MSKHWKEKRNPEIHRDFMSTDQIGGVEVKPVGESPSEEWVFFVRECSFTFQFMDLGQLDEMIDYVSQKIHPSTRRSNDGLEHYWQSWQERLPKGLLKGARREKIAKALLKVKADFENSQS
jgi:hypothetical protein